MKRGLLFFFFFIPVLVFCQKLNTDSLRNVIKTTRNDSAKVQALIGLANEYKNNNADTAIILCKQAEGLSLKIGYINGIANSQHLAGWCNYFKGDYPEALELFFKALALWEKRSKNADSTLLKMIAEKKSELFNNTGSVYFEMGQIEKALSYYTKGLESAESFNIKEQMVTSIGNIGIFYDQIGDYRKAMAFYKRALKLNEELGRKKGIGNNLGNIGGMYYSQKQFNIAIDYYMKAMKIFEEIDYKYGVAVNLTNIGSVYTDLNQWQKAKEFYVRSLEISKEIKNMQEIRDLNMYISDVCEHLGEDKEALKYYKNYTAAKDTILNVANAKKSVELEMQYVFDKKEAATQLDQEKRDGIALAEKKKQTVIFYSVCGVLLLVIGFAVFVYRSFLQKRKDNILIQKQKLEVEEKQKEILDSINYAKRIQKAQMPSDTYIAKNTGRLKDKG